MIYQEPEIIPGVDVAENIYAGELPVARPFIDRTRLNARVARGPAALRLRGRPADRAMGDELSPAQRQLVEIMRALKSRIRVLALDEPTSSLTDEEVDRLFALVRRLRAEGVAIIYVSHRLNEILRLADRVAVLRDGALVAVRPACELTEREIVRLMVGRELADVFRRTPRRHGSGRAAGRGHPQRLAPRHRLRDPRRRGRGFAGLVGAGRTELAKVIFGDLPRTAGTVIVEGREVRSAARGRHPPRHRPRARGPQARGPDPHPVACSRTPRSPSSGGSAASASCSRRLERRIGIEYVKRLAVRTPSLDQEVGKLSGGNQQKVVLARWLAARPKVLILDEPTRGIDVGAKAEIYRLIDELANEGLAIMLISSELPEILGLSDRIYVMQGGRITGELPGGEADRGAGARAGHGGAPRRRPPSRPRRSRKHRRDSVTAADTGGPVSAGTRAADEPPAARRHRAVGVDNLSLIVALVLLVLIIATSARCSASGRPVLLVLAEPHEQPRPEHRHRRAAGHRRDGRHRRRRARHLGRLDRHRRLGGRGDRRHPGRDRHLRRRLRCRSPIAGRASSAGAVCGIINGLIVTVLKVNPIIATLGTLAAFDGLAFLLAPEGKPIGVVTQPDFTWLGTGRFFEDLRDPALGGRPWPGVPVIFVVLIVVAVAMHS